LSGVHVTGLQDATIWEIAKKSAGNEPGRRTIYARADVPVEQFIKQKLRAIRDDTAFLRHTSVSGWPQIADLDEQKEQWKAICLALSEAPEVRLVMPFSTIRVLEQ
jgi:hypothetical protein